MWPRPVVVRQLFPSGLAPQSDWLVSDILSSIIAPFGSHRGEPQLAGSSFCRQHHHPWLRDVLHLQPDVLGMQIIVSYMRLQYEVSVLELTDSLKTIRSDCRDKQEASMFQLIPLESG